LTGVELDGRPAAGILRDAQLDEEPEFLQEAGVAVLLARDNAGSRRRMATASFQMVSST
jgi:hypothetical protein